MKNSILWQGSVFGSSFNSALRAELDEQLFHATLGNWETGKLGNCRKPVAQLRGFIYQLTGFGAWRHDKFLENWETVGNRLRSCAVTSISWLDSERGVTTNSNHSEKSCRLPSKCSIFWTIRVVGDCNSRVLLFQLCKLMLTPCWILVGFVQTCSWIPKMDPKIWSHGSGSGIPWDHISTLFILSKDPLDHRSEFVFFGGSTEIIDPMYTFCVRSTGIIDPDKKRPCGIQETQRRKMKLKVLGHIYKK